jgi:hypothetical protein
MLQDVMRRTNTVLLFEATRTAQRTKTIKGDTQTYGQQDDRI